MTAQKRPPSTADQGGDTDNFRLEGPSIALDPRIHAFRADIADLALAGQVFATHYARPEPRLCALPTAMMQSSPESTGPAISQLLYGEQFCVLDITRGWAWGYSRHDHYVGYVREEALGAAVPAAAPVPAPYVVAARQALVFADADIKSPLAMRLPLGARITALETGGNGMVRMEKGWVHPRHIIPAGKRVADFVTMAERLMGTPYLWGGRASNGIDCSGLLQLALSFAGIHAPRDSDQQRDTLGRPVKGNSLRRGDLVFFPGHVGIMADDHRLIHASGYWMQVVIEPLAEVIALFALTHDQPVQAVKRL